MTSIEINPKKREIGTGFFVRRSLPTAKKRMIGPFIFWDHMGPIDTQAHGAMVVPPHPHIGLSTLTWLLQGEILHRDSLGSEVVIKPGEVNWMTSGAGITHSERSISQGLLEGIQIWIALPKGEEGRSPSFHHYDISEIPYFEKDDILWHLIAGDCFNHKSPVEVYSSLFLLQGLSQKDHNFHFQLGQEDEAALYIYSSHRKEADLVDDIEVEEGSSKMIIFEKGSLVEYFLPKGSHFFFLGGKSFPEKRHIFWNFVSSSHEEIEHAKDRWKEQKFPKVPNEKEFVPLPE